MKLNTLIILLIYSEIQERKQIYFGREGIHFHITGLHENTRFLRHNMKPLETFPKRVKIKTHFSATRNLPFLWQQTVQNHIP